MKLPVLSWLDEPIEQSIKSVFDDVNIGVESLDILKKYKNNHFSQLFSEVSKIKVFGMSTPINLLDIYSDTYISTTIHRRLYAEDWRSFSTKDEHLENRNEKTSSNKVRGLSFIKKHDRVVILGGPGAGKTTFLKYLALIYTNKEIFKKNKLGNSYFPFFVGLPIISKTDDSIEEHLSRKLKKSTNEYANDFILRLLKKGRAIILFDSLDEVPIDQRQSIIDKVNDFSHTYPKTKVIVSCRTADYEGSLSNFCEAEVSKLTEPAIKKIVKAWFKTEPEKATHLISSIASNKDIRQLTETPLLLSLLCIQFNNDLRLPARKMELYKRCIDALLLKWDTSRNFRRDTAFSQLTDDRKEKMFEFIAGTFFCPKPSYVFHESVIEPKIGDYCQRFQINKHDAKSVIHEIESHHGIIEKYSAETYCFSHPSFQEYFAAKRFLTTNKDREIVKKYYSDEDWSSVIEFIIAMKEDPQELIDILKKSSTMNEIKQYPAMTTRTYNLWLLYRCLASGPSLNPIYLKSAIGHIYHSQIEMFRIYKDGGVFPIATLLPDGVSHAYYYEKKRKTLSKALQQYRKLSNEILNTKFNLYAQYVVDQASRVLDSSTSLVDIFQLLCISIPVSSHLPEQVNHILKKCLKELPDDVLFLRNTIEASQNTLEEHYLPE